MKNDNEPYNVLLKKWELLWNHYKLQNEAIEKRRNFLWIIQGALFVAWYHFMDSLISILVIPFGIIINLIWIIIFKRDAESLFLTEESLRDTEDQFNTLSIDIKIDKFKIDQICLFENKPYKWKFSKQEFDYEKNSIFWKADEKPYRRLYYFIECIIKKFKIRSVRDWLTWIVPRGILWVWILLAIITLIKVGITLIKVGYWLHLSIDHW